MKRILAAVVMVIALLLGSLAYPFDKEPTKVDVLGNGYAEEAALALPSVTTTGTGWGYYRRDDGVTTAGVGVFEMRGSGFVVDRGFIVTAAHVVAPRRVAIRIASSTYLVTKLYGIMTRQVMIGDCQPANIVYEDVENDIAVLRFHVNTVVWRALPYKPTWTRAFIWTPFGIGQMNMLGKEDAVGVLVHKRAEDGEFAWGWEVRWGKVRDTAPRVPSGLEEALPWFGMDDVTLDLEVIPGDSGSPVIAVDKGQIILVGVARASAGLTTQGLFAYMVRIDSIIPLLEGTP